MGLSSRRRITDMAITPAFASDIGGAVSDIFSAIGSGKAATTYKQAQQMELQNVQYEKENVMLQEAQEQRKIELGIGREKAQVSGAGFTAGGSALDLLRMSQEQGAITKAAIGVEGQIQENAYAAQASAYGAQASAASTAQKGGFFGALLQGASAIFSLF